LDSIRVNTKSPNPYALQRTPSGVTACAFHRLRPQPPALNSGCRRFNKVLVFFLRDVLKTFAKSSNRSIYPRHINLYGRYADTQIETDSTLAA